MFQLPARADPCSVEWTDTALTILFKSAFPDAPRHWGHYAFALNVLLHPQLLFSADGHSVGATQTCTSNCMPCHTIHRNFPKPAKT